MINMK